MSRATTHLRRHSEFIHIQATALDLQGKVLPLFLTYMGEWNGAGQKVDGDLLS